MAITVRLSLTGGLRWYDSYDVTDATQVNVQVSKGFRLGDINDPSTRPSVPRRTSPPSAAAARGRTRRCGTTRRASSRPFSAAAARSTPRASTWTSATCRRPSRPAPARPASSSTCPTRAAPAGELELAAQPTTFFDFAVSASVADARLQSTITSTDANRGRPAPADDAPLPGRDRGHVALAGRRRLGRLPQRDLPARRLDEAVRLDVPFPGREPAGRGPRPTLRSTPSSCAPADGGHR